MYSLLAAVVASFLLGGCLGIKLLTNAINFHIACGDVVVFINGKRLHEYKLFTN